jgi:hypothetical protein
LGDIDSASVVTDGYDWSDQLGAVHLEPASSFSEDPGMSRTPAAGTTAAVNGQDHRMTTSESDAVHAAFISPPYGADVAWPRRNSPPQPTVVPTSNGAGTPAVHHHRRAACQPTRRRTTRCGTPWPLHLVPRAVR